LFAYSVSRVYKTRIDRSTVRCVLTNGFTYIMFFFFQAEDGIRDRNVTGVQTCALPISVFELEDGLLPHSAIYPIRSWISQVGSEGASLERIRARTLTGAVSALPGKVNALADFAQSQEQAHSELAASLDRCFSAADSVLAEVFSDGRVLHGEVNARWQDFVGTGQLFRGLEPTMARMRDRISSAVTGKHDAATPLHIAILRSAAVSLREQAIAVVD